MRTTRSPRGRHRLEPSRLRTRTRIGLGVAFVATAGFAAVSWPASAIADAPVQVGWWSTVGGAPSSAPEGGMHVEVEPGSVTAYGAVLYLLPEGATGTLELSVSSLTATPVINPTAPSTDPAVAVQACPTKDATWKAGDNQSMDTAPQYDCTVRSYIGALSADQKTLTFIGVDGGGQSVPGELSLAIVPITTNAVPGAGTQAPLDTTQPWSMDIAKPEADSLTVTLPPVSTTGGGGTSTDTTSSTPATTAGGGGTATGGGGSVAPLTVSGGDLPDSTTTATGSDGTAPVVATTQPSQGTPVAAVAPKTDNRAHNAALAMLILLGIVLAMSANGGVPRAPRLLGGAGRHRATATPVVVGATAGAAAAAPAPAAPAVAMTPYGSRGLGRFNKPRSAPPRPLI